MEWLNLHSSVLDSEQFIGAEPLDRATWLCLLRYCAGQENGGVIRDCEQWGDRKWQQLARVLLSEVERESTLWEWDGPDLRVWFYPVEAETKVKRLRVQAKEAAESRWGGANGQKPPKAKAAKRKRKPKVDWKKKDGHPGTDLIAEHSQRLNPASRFATEEPPP